MKERAVITIIGIDEVGILAKVSACCAEAGANVKEMSQNVMSDFFTLIMLVEINEDSLTALRDAISSELPNMQVNVMHEKIFEAMHMI